MDANLPSSKNRADESAHLNKLESGGRAYIARGADRRAPPELPSNTPFPLPLFSCDAHGAVISCNEAAVALWGRNPDFSQRGQWSGALDLLERDGSKIPRSRFPAALAFQTQADINGLAATLLRPDGSTRRVMVYAKTTLQADGAVSEVICAIFDHTERDALIEAANRAEDEKNAFLAMVSHELRNPLSPILNAAVVMKQVSKDAQVSKMADVVERQAKRLARFVQDLLHAANLAQGGVALTIGRTTHREVMQAALDQLMALAAARRQRVSVDMGTSAALLCDAERVSQALANIMANASEFTGENGLISARVSIEGVWLRIEIEDTGIGIDPKNLDHIFKPYTQFATHAERARAGIGLGLALAKDICDKHGGSIVASSAGLGHGSVFVVSLPIVELTE